VVPDSGEAPLKTAGQDGRHSGREDETTRRRGGGGSTRRDLGRREGWDCRLEACEKDWSDGGVFRVGAGGDGEARWKDGREEVGGRGLAAAEARISEEDFRQTEWVREGV
jgi:hypothetical protein